MTISSVEPAANGPRLIYHEDALQKYAVEWNGFEWVIAYQDNRRIWYHSKLHFFGYLHLLDHYGLEQHWDIFPFDLAKRTKPQELVAARRENEKRLNLKPKQFRKGIDY